jgi:hypothetical protein
MSGNAPMLFRERLERFSHRLEARSRECEERGFVFGYPPARLMKEIAPRAEKLRARVDVAARQEAYWNLVKAEFVRDRNALFDDFEQLEEQLEADAMRMKKSSAG